MNDKSSRKKRITFVLMLVFALLSVAVTTPADQIFPGPPGRTGATQAMATHPATAPEPSPAPEITAQPDAAEEEVLSAHAEDISDIAPAPPEKTQSEIDPEDDEDYLGEPEDEPDPNVEPDEEISFIDAMIQDAYLTDDAMAAVNGMTHILLIGLDARPGQTTGRSDTMIILTLDAEHNAIKMTSLMRDLYVEIPGRKNNRINSAYVYGGPELLMKTIEANFGVKIDSYVGVNFSTLASVIDQIGGLTIDVNSKYVKRINAVIKEDNKVLKLPTSDGLLTQGGEQLLTGKQAQAYARYRYGTSDGDFGRTVRQREVVLKALDKVKTMSMSELVRLAMNNMDKIVTNMSITDMVRLAPALFQLREMEVRELRIPVDGGYSSRTISGMSVLVPDRTKNRQAINQFLLEGAE